MVVTIRSAPTGGALGFLAAVGCAAVALAGCEQAEPTAEGLTCGATRCASDQVCCIDCAGQGSCGAPGLVCRCDAADDASINVQFPADASAGIRCGDALCAAGQTCCIDCDGRGSCGDPGAVCQGKACVREPDARPEPLPDASVVPPVNIGTRCKAAGGRCECGCDKGYDTVYTGARNDCPQPCDGCGACSLACCIPFDAQKVGEKCRAAGGHCSCSCPDGFDQLLEGEAADCPGAGPGSLACDDVCCLPTSGGGK